MPVNFSPSSLAFGLQAVGTTSAPQTLRVTNTDESSLMLAVMGFMFSPSTIGAGQTVDVSVTFSPTAAESYDYRRLGDASQSFSFTGRGVRLSITPTELAFGEQPIGRSETRYVLVSFDAGTGAGAATLGGLSAPFSADASSVSSSTSPTQVAITFSPTSTATSTGTLTLTAANVGGVTPTCAVSGTGVQVSAFASESEAESDYVHTRETDERYQPGGIYYDPNAAAVTGSEKYWEIELDHTAENRTMNSYLRLGSAESNTKLPADGTRYEDDADASDRRGHDLAAMIVDFRDDTRDRGTEDSGALHGRFPSVADRQAESKKLHTRGGWRDHSDGNRISTTRGDKIEVVQGNYHMLVLGRFDNRGSGARTETSGGHVAGDTETQTPGAVLEVKWSPEKYNGTWKIVQETLKGDVINRYHGDVENYFYGNKQVNIIGSESSATPIFGDGVTGVDSTSDEQWVTSGASSEMKLKPEIISKTWAKSIASEVYTDGTTEKVEVTGFKWSNTIVKGCCLNTTSVAGPLINTTSVAGVLLDMVNTSVHLVEELSLLNVSLFLGYKVDISPDKLKTELTIDKAGIHTKVDEVAALKTELTADIKKVSGRVTKVRSSVTKLQGKVTTLTTNEQNIVNNYTQLSTKVDLIAGHVNFV